MIKYIGSKRRLVPVLAGIVEQVGARHALDLFTGTTRVAQAFKRAGAEVTAVDSTRCAALLAACYIATDARSVDVAELTDAVAALNALPGEPGYVTDTFCIRSRYFQPHNGARIDAIREAIARDHGGSPLEPVLLTSLIEAADRVDSTTGLQMAYVKQWSARSYNQHRYDSNYHIWETLVAWDAPEHYGVACKRVDLRHVERSPFNSRRTMPAALAQVVRDVRADVVVLSYNDESFLSLDQLVDLCSVRGDVEVLAFPSARYVGARIGIHDPSGRRVGTVGRLHNVEYVLVAGARQLVRRAVGQLASARSSA